MLFPTTHFLLFFLVVAALVAALEHRFTAKKAVLVVASYYFYAQWDWRFCFLLGCSTALSYGAGLIIGATAEQTRRRIVLGQAEGGQDGSGALDEQPRRLELGQLLDGHHLPGIGAANMRALYILCPRNRPPNGGAAVDRLYGGI